MSYIPNFGDAVSLAGDGHLSVCRCVSPQGYAASSAADAASSPDLGICDTTDNDKEINNLRRGGE